MKEYYVVMDLDCMKDEDSDTVQVFFGVAFDNNGKGFRSPREAAAYHDWYFSAQKASAIRRKKDRPMGYCNCVVALVRSV